MIVGHLYFYAVSDGRQGTEDSGKESLNQVFGLLMASDDTFLLFLLPVELLLQIPYAVAMSLVGFLCPVFESLDFLPTLCEFRLKFLGLVSGESVGEIAEGILTVGVTLGFRFDYLLLSLGGDYRHDRDMKVWVSFSA